MTTILCSVVSLIFTNLEDGDELDHVVDDGDAVVAEHVAVAVLLLELDHGLPVHLAEAGEGLHTELQGSLHQGRGYGLGDQQGRSCKQICWPPGFGGLQRVGLDPGQYDHHPHGVVHVGQLQDVQTVVPVVQVAHLGLITVCSYVTQFWALLGFTRLYWASLSLI